METKNVNPRRKFITQFASDAIAIDGLAFIPQTF